MKNLRRYIDINTHIPQNTISLHTRMAKMCHMETEVQGCEQATIKFRPKHLRNVHGVLI